MMLQFTAYTTDCIVRRSAELEELKRMSLCKTSKADCSMTVAAICGRSWERDLGVAELTAPNGKPLFVFRDNYLLGEAFYRLIQEGLTDDAPFSDEEKRFYRGILKEIAEIEAARGRTLQLGGVKADVEKLLQKLGLEGTCFTNEDLYDYCYSRETFATLAGRPMAKKRNFCRRFERNRPDAKFVYFEKSPDAETLERWKAFLADWYEANQPLDETLFFERKFLDVVLCRWDECGVTGGMLADGDFQRFSLRYTKKVVDALIKENDGARVPSIVFTKGGGEWLEDIASIGCDAVGLDWTTNISRARRVVGDRVALQGNLDPFVLFGSEEAIRREVRRVLDGYGEVGAGGHVFNLGHGINQFTPVESVQIVADEVHEYSRRYHG